MKSRKAKEINKKKNQIEFINDNVIKVYTNNNTNYFICDYEDWIKYKCYKICWRIVLVDKTYNSLSIIGNNCEEQSKTVSFHRYIFKNIENYEIDHKNGNRLDNRKINLRKCKRSQNSKNLKRNKRNTSGTTGVGWDKKSNKWRARINCNGKEYNLGNFTNKEDAIKIRKEYEEKLFKDFSSQNSRGSDYIINPPSLEQIIKEIKGENK